MGELDDEHRLRLEEVIDFASQIAGGDYAARRSVSERRDEIDAVVACLNLVAEDFGIEHERRRAAEEELRDTVEAYESAPAMFCSVDASTGVIVQCNRTMERALGRARAALLGAPLEGLYRPAAREHARACLAALLTDGLTPPGDHELLTAEGKAVTTLQSGTVVRDAAGTPRRLRLIYRDVGEERHLEAQLLQAQKMEGIGRLAGGIAHDFNNLLTVILSCGEMLRGAVLPEGADDLEEVMRAAARAAELTGQLLAFSRRTVVAPRAIDVNDALRDMDKLLRRALGETIEIVTVYHPAPWTVAIDPSRFEQVIMNLAINARDAMPQGGRLTLETQNVVLDDEYVRVHHGVRPGEYVMLAVSDQGAGMGREVLERLFEPFFTTKEVGRGTGLGLAMAWGIVRQAGGTIAVYSEPGAGSTFKIYLPRELAPSQKAERDGSITVGGGSEQVLVVEDEPLVRALVVRTLRRAGYDVCEAPDGVAALELLRARGRPVDLTITDVVMPRLGGRDLAERLAAEGLCRVVLFASGYTSNAIVHQGVLEEGRAFLQKPFTPAALLSAVRKVLNGG
ncbi:MAG: ATP-binding protein [Polyangiaceae bacterium]